MMWQSCHEVAELVAAADDVHGSRAALETDITYREFYFFYV